MPGLIPDIPLIGMWPSFRLRWENPRQHQAKYQIDHGNDRQRRKD
jgi:hypothetical protein